MAELLKGAAVAKAIGEDCLRRSEALRERGVTPTLAILRVGEREDDLSYERGAMKRADQAGVAVRSVCLPADVDSETFFSALDELNRDESVHGILMLRPLPAHIDGERARLLLHPKKDVDGCTDGSLAGVFTGQETGFAPCTAQAAMEILQYYGINPKGKRAVVIGRSLVVGRPVAMMLMHANATVTVCHTRTEDVPAEARRADIVIAACGQMESIGADFVREGQILVDVGIGWNEEKGKLCGDVRFEEVQPVVAAITPVPGGVGAVTTAVLCKHVIEAAERTL